MLNTNGPLLGKGHRTPLRTRRRWATYAYLLAALGVGYVLLNTFSPFASTHEDDHGLGGRLEGLMPTAIPGMGYSAKQGTTMMDSNSKASPKGKGQGKGRGKTKVTNSPPPDHAHAFQPHKWRPDGLLEVNPNGRHPIFDLIERAEKEWESKLARQSKSLDEAVAEYRRRYGRSPPKGFDRWWDYIEEHNVQLPDEYDLITHDLEAFWGLSPTDLRALQSSLEGHPDSWTMGKTGAYGMMLVNMSLQDNGMSTHLAAAYEMLDTLRPVQDMLPRFRAVFNPHDSSWIGRSEEFQSMARRAGKAGKHLNLKNIKTESTGWLSACSKSSPARRTPFDLARPPPPPSPATKTFIYDHLSAMDPCLHPTILHQHGQFLTHESGPGPIVPQLPGFSFSPSSMHADIRVATPFGWMEDIDQDGTGDDPVWENKTDDRLMWRGRTTGMWHGKNMRYWRQSQRERMILYADANANATRGSSSSSSILVGGDKDEGFRTRTTSVQRVNEAALDMKFADEPIGCDEEDGTCDEMKGMYAFAPAMDWRAAGKYKYVMDIDGNAWSSRFKRLLTSRSLVFKATAYPEWFAQRIQPWVHYIPVQLDYSDLYDALLFFRGDETAERRGAHEELGRKIAMEGRRWSKEMWRREDLTAYNFRLMLEYARLMSFDREAATYHEEDGDGDDNEEVW